MDKRGLVSAGGLAKLAAALDMTVIIADIAWHDAQSVPSNVIASGKGFMVDVSKLTDLDNFADGVFSRYWIFC